MNDTIAKRDQLSEILGFLIDELDIPESKYREAEDRYKSVGEWLERPSSKVRLYSPVVYVQGSFRLGTVIKQVNSDGEYDIDAVCVIDLKTSQCSQQQLKLLIGREIMAYARARAMKKPAKEGRRCWTLKYADDSHFHMDVLPAIPNAQGFRILLETKGVKSDWTCGAIAITDNTRPDYEDLNAIWPVSNPKGYSDWFRSRMRDSASNIYKQTALLMEQFARVEDVPTFMLKTPLQRVVQILKHHRDSIYGDDGDKPISIIIATLAAHAYNNEGDLLTALINIVPRMLDKIEDRDSILWIENPVNPLENFADKWTEHPERKRKFYEWHAAISKGLNLFLDSLPGLQHMNEGLVEIAGEDVANRTMKRYGTSILDARENGTLKAAVGTATLGTTGTPVKGHTFYGT
ncbi:MAG: nucleotidyltransferase [Acidobacteriota bacterium]|jgi:hypothetical protein|nr:nucleotidyltransferase [Acidobacteriota bacterium]